MMSAHIFLLERWYRDHRLDGWNFDDTYLVIEGDKLTELTSGGSAPYWKDKAKEQYPDAIWHDEALSVHRGLLEHGDKFVAFATDYPVEFAALNANFKWKEQPVPLVKCNACNGDGVIMVMRNTKGEVDYIGGRPTSETATCETCGGEGYVAS